MSEKIKMRILESSKFGEGNVDDIKKALASKGVIAVKGKLTPTTFDVNCCQCGYFKETNKWLKKCPKCGAELLLRLELVGL